MSRKWRERNAYVMARTAYDKPEDVGVVDEVGSSTFNLIGGGQQYTTPNQGTADTAYTPYDDYTSQDEYTYEPVQNGTNPPDSPEYPGAREFYHTEWMDAAEYNTAYPDLSIKDNIDYQVGGQFGLVNNLPYSLGVVEPNNVENFELDGRQVELRRETDQRMQTGPVGTSDSSALLAIAYAQQVNQYYPNEVSQADMVVSV